MTCTKAQEFLDQKKVTADTVVDARKNQMGATEALKLARSVDAVVSTKGGKIVQLEPKKASDEDLLAALLGPTGNLRAPAVRTGNKLLVGFDEKIYKEALL